MAERRAWCSCTIIDYLKGEEWAKDCILILADADKGGMEIVVSIMAQVEVAKINSSDEDDERIDEFFARRYVKPAALDVVVAERARELIRNFGLGSADAVHVATALVHDVPIFETFDKALTKKIENKGGIEGLTIRPALYEGTRPLILPDETLNA